MEQSRASSDSVDPTITSALHSVPQFAAQFEVVSKLGQGSFSVVVLARCKTTDHKFAVKCLVPTTCPQKASNELLILRKLGGCNNVINISCSFRNQDRIFFIMDYFPHDHFSTFIHDASFDEISDYVKNLLIALSHVHKFKVIHRDVKATNFLFNRTLKKYRLIDFGLAEYEGEQSRKRKIDETTNVENTCSDLKKAKTVASKRDRADVKKLLGSTTNQLEAKDDTLAPVFSNTSKNCRPFSTDVSKLCHCFGRAFLCKLCKGRKKERVNKAGTAGFRAPEILLNHAHQTVAVDIWSAGVMFLGLLTRRYPFMKPKDDESALAQLITLFGTEPLALLAKKLGKKLICQPTLEGLDLKSLCCCFRCSSKDEIKQLFRNNQIDESSRDTQSTAATVPTRCSKCSKNVCSPVRQLCLCKFTMEVPTQDDVFLTKAVTLLEKMLSVDPKRRIAAQDALSDIFFHEKWSS